MHSPGRHLAVLLSKRGFSQNRLAVAATMCRQAISDIVNDKKPITVPTALLIGKALGEPAEILLDIQWDADLARLRAALKDRLAKVVRLTEKAA